MYSDVVMDHFKNPRNIGVIKDANIVVKVGDPSCGDALLVFFKIADERVQDIKYKIFGCGAAIAVSSIASEMAKGRTLDEVMLITRESIADALQGLPADKMHCSNLAAAAFHAAVNGYRKGAAAPADTPDAG